MTPQQQQAAVQQDETPAFDDPLERQLYEEQQARKSLEQRFEQMQTNTVLERAIGSLQTTQGASEDDSRAVVQAALQMGLGPQAFPMIYQSMQYQKMQAGQEAQQQHADASQAQDAQRQQAAAQANGQVNSGAGVNSHGTTTALDPNRRVTVREAFDEAYTKYD